MRCAILGAGLAGLSVAWHLLRYTQGSATIDLYDPEPIGGGASGLSSGLLHTFGGRHAKRSWEASRSLKETHRLITEASRAIDQPLILSKGILRPAILPEQIAAFQKIAHEYPQEVEWWNRDRAISTVLTLQLPQEGGGLMIKAGLTLDTQGYLQGLWKACALLGTQFHQQAMVQKSELEAYDRILIAMGPMTKNFPPLKDLPLTPVKGQVLELEWPLKIKPPPFSLISQKYLVMHPSGKSCTVGATYEHDFISAKVEQEKAAQDILPKVTAFFPALGEAKILRCRAAFRASTPNHLPIAGKINEQFYFFSGLGSKGLLYHGWLGKRVARMLLTKDPGHLPKEVFFQT